MSRRFPFSVLLFCSAACMTSISVRAQEANPAPPTSPAAAPAQNPGADEPLGQGEGRAVATKLAEELLKSFVFHDKAEDYAAMLRKNAASGRYDAGTRGRLAKLLTDDMLSVHKDGH